jgi:hypothetical protein
MTPFDAEPGTVQLIMWPSFQPQHEPQEVPLPSTVRYVSRATRHCPTKRSPNKKKSFRARKREEHGLERISRAEGLVLN